MGPGTRAEAPQRPGRGRQQPLSATVAVAVLEAAPDAMAVTDGRGLIVLANAQAEALFGYGRGELVGKPLGTLVPGCSHLPGLPRRRPGPAGPAPTIGGRLQGRRKDGAAFPVDIRLSRLRTPAGPLIVVSARTASRRLQHPQARQVIPGAPAPREERLASDLTARTIAHDVNNALVPILGFTELILRRPRWRNNGAVLTDYVQRIRTAAQSAASLIGRLQESA